MIKKRSKSPRVGLFWHIPWPNAEAFREFVLGTRNFFNGMPRFPTSSRFTPNITAITFLETCNRYLGSANRLRAIFGDDGQSRNLSAGLPDRNRYLARENALTDSEIEELEMQNMEFDAEKVAVGVDRLDYTKGLVERDRAIGRKILGKESRMGSVVFLSPKWAPLEPHAYSRMHQNLATQLDQVIQRVNTRFSQVDRSGVQSDCLGCPIIPGRTFSTFIKWAMFVSSPLFMTG